MERCKRYPRRPDRCGLHSGSRSRGPRGPRSSAGKADISASTDRPREGCCQPGAKSRIGNRTNARSAMRGCGRIGTSLGLLISPLYANKSMSIILASLRIRRVRPNFVSIVCNMSKSAAGERSVSTEATPFTNQGWPEGGTGAVWNQRECPRTVTSRSPSSINAASQVDRGGPRHGWNKLAPSAMRIMRFRIASMVACKQDKFG